MKRIKLIIAFCTFTMSCVNAQQITKEIAVLVATNELYSICPPSDYGNGPSLDTAYTLTRDGNILIYEMCFNTGERVFVSGNRSCHPILAYIGKPSYEKTGVSYLLSDETPDGLKDLIAEYAEQVSLCFEKSVHENKHEKAWYTLQKLPDSTINRELRSVSPLMTTEWGQSNSNDTRPAFIDYYAYNYYAPSGTICTKCYAGCGAVAMAQILKYWNQPASVPFKCSQYDWSNMPNKLIQRKNDNYETERNAIAKLIYDCGVYSNMDYCRGENNRDICSSGNRISQAETGFSRMGYNGNLYYRTMTDSIWINYILNDLNNNRPIYYRASTSPSPNEGSAHAFVCDGYIQDGTGSFLFHFNFGWNGDANDYYYLNSMVNGYNYNHAAIFNIQPTSCWDTIIMECNKTFSSIATYMSTESIIENNYHTFAFSGCYAELTAGEEIVLTNGFSVNEGTEFQAYISPCGGSAKGEDSQYSEWYEEDTLEEITELPQSTKLILRPNPTTGLVHVNFADNRLSIRQVEVRNLLGTSVLKTANPQGNTLDVSALPAGVYIVRIVTNDGKQEFAKLVKK